MAGDEVSDTTRDEARLGGISKQRARASDFRTLETFFAIRRGSSFVTSVAHTRTQSTIAKAVM